MQRDGALRSLIGTEIGVHRDAATDAVMGRARVVEFRAFGVRDRVR